MPSAIVATAGSASANSFVTDAEMDAYCDDRSNASAWNDQTDDDIKTRALFDAARDLELLPWAGSRTDSTQALSWPREYVVNPDLPWATVEADDDYYFDNDVVPQRVKDAQMELALEYLKAGTTDLAARDSKLDVKRKKTDVLETEYFGPGSRARGIARFPRVLDLLGPLMDESVWGVTKVVRT